MEKARRTITRKDSINLFKELIFTGYQSKAKNHRHRIEMDVHLHEYYMYVTLYIPAALLKSPLPSSNLKF